MNSARFPRSRKIIGPTQEWLRFQHKIYKVVPDSRKFQEIKIFFFVTHLHIILHLYTKFQVNPTNCFRVLVHTRMVKIFSIKFTKWFLESRKSKFSFSLHIYILFCISIPNFKLIQ